MRLRIGGCSIVLDQHVTLPAPARPFRDPTGDSCDLFIEFQAADRSVIGQRLFQAGRVWELWGDEERRQFALVDNRGGPPIATATFQPAWPRTCVLACDADQDRDELLFGYPLLQLLLIEYLASGHQRAGSPLGRGALLHACAVIDRGLALVLVGPPEAGKSTSAALWHAAGATVLSDDRVVVRADEQGPRLIVSGTPWHSSTPVSSAVSAPIDGLIFLSHGPVNRLVPLAPSAALRRLLPELYKPLWDATLLEATLDLADLAISRVPCFELAFVPDSSMVAYVRAFFER